MNVQINLLSVLCQRGDKDKYSNTVDPIIGAAKQIREEVATMEVDILVSETMTEILKKSKPQMENAVKEVQLSVLMASSKSTVSYSDRVIVCITACMHSVLMHACMVVPIFCVTVQALWLLTVLG